MDQKFGSVIIIAMNINWIAYLLKNYTFTFANTHLGYTKCQVMLHVDGN